MVSALLHDREFDWKKSRGKMINLILLIEAKLWDIVLVGNPSVR